MEQLKKDLHILKPQKSSQSSETDRDRTISESQTGVGPAEKQLLARSSSEKPEVADRRSTRHISRQQLINKLNYLNFINGSIQANFKHPAYGETSSLQAYPMPCLGNRLECRWAEGINTHILKERALKSTSRPENTDRF